MQMLLIYLTVSGMLHHGHHISLYNTPTNPYLEIKIDSSVKINQIYIILIFIPDQFSRFKPFSRIINLFLFTFLFLFPQLFPSLLAAFDMLFMAFLRSHFQIAFFSLSALDKFNFHLAHIEGNSKIISPGIFGVLDLFPYFYPTALSNSISILCFDLPPFPRK